MHWGNKHPKIVKHKNINGRGQTSKEVGQNGENPSKKEAVSPSKESSGVKGSQVFCAELIRIQLRIGAGENLKPFC